MPRTLRRWRLLKKPPGHLGSDPGGPPERYPHRTMVAGRGARGSEEQDRPTLGPTRHPAPRPDDQRTSAVYIVGAICPQEGKGAARVVPRCGLRAMSLLLAGV